MGQIEVFEILKYQRQRGSNKFYTVAEVKKLLINENYALNHGFSGTAHDLLRLELSGYLEPRLKGGFNNERRAWRVKKEYLKKW